jgi:hypothetical protein
MDAMLLGGGAVVIAWAPVRLNGAMNTRRAMASMALRRIETTLFLGIWCRQRDMCLTHFGGVKPASVRRCRRHLSSVPGCGHG